MDQCKRWTCTNDRLNDYLYCEECKPDNAEKIDPAEKAAELGRKLFVEEDDIRKDLVEDRVDTKTGTVIKIKPDIWKFFTYDCADKWEADIDRTERKIKEKLNIEYGRVIVDNDS